MLDAALKVQQPSDREAGVIKEPRAGSGMIWWGFTPLFHEDAQAVKQEPGEVVEPPNSKVFKRHLGPSPKQCDLNVMLTLLSAVGWTGDS